MYMCDLKCTWFDSLQCPAVGLPFSVLPNLHRENFRKFKTKPFTSLASRACVPVFVW